MKTYGKWEQAGEVRRSDGWEDVSWTRTVTGPSWLGFIRERVERITFRFPLGHDPFSGRVLRVLNGEPEAAPTLDYFSTEDLKAELARRKRESR